MTTRPRRLTGHFRRHAIAYAALVVAFSLSPIPSMAADLVTARDIANGAVTQPKLAADSVVSGKIADETVSSGDIMNGTVKTADLAENAKGAKVLRYDLGTWNFFNDSLLQVQLPGYWTDSAMANSAWTVMMKSSWNDAQYIVPGFGYAASSAYTVIIRPDGILQIEKVSGDGEPYVDIRVFRTVATSSQTAP